MRSSSAFLIAVLLASAFAGCAQTDPPAATPSSTPTDPAADPAASPTPANPTPTKGGSGAVAESEAKAKLVAAFEGLSDSKLVKRFGAELSFFKEDVEAAKLKFAGDGETAEGVVHVSIDPAILSQAQQASPIPFTASEFTLYNTARLTATGEVTVVDLPDRTYTVYDPTAEKRAWWNFSKAARESPASDPFGGFFQGLRDYTAFNVSDPEAITHKGHPALRVNFTSDASGSKLEGTIILYTDLKLPASAKVRVVGEGGTPAPSSGLFDTGTYDVEFSYNDDVTFEVPEKIARSALLANKKESTDPKTQVFTFHATGPDRIPVGDLEVQVKESPFAAAFRAYGKKDSNESKPADGVYFRMPFSAGTKAEGNFTAEFTDADKDGLVGNGDTLSMRLEADGTSFYQYEVGFFDAKTGSFVTPGFELALLGLAALGASRLLRRR